MTVAARLRELVDRHDLPAGADDALTRLLAALADPRAPTAVHDPAEAVDVHVADSLAALDLDELRNAIAIADLGAGAGLPGLALAIALPDAHVTLVESVQRKCAFLASTADAVGLRNVEIVCARAEGWPGGRDRQDAVCARALGALPVLCEYAAPLLRHGGALIAWKGRMDPAEEAAGAWAAATLGLEPAGARRVEPYPGSRHRTLYLFRKVRPTPPGYPRRPGMAAKRPLGQAGMRLSSAAAPPRGGDPDRSPRSTSGPRDDP